MKKIDEIRMLTAERINQEKNIIQKEKETQQEKIFIEFKNFEIQMDSFIKDVFHKMEIQASFGLEHLSYFYEVPNPSTEENFNVERFINICIKYFEEQGFFVKYKKYYKRNFFFTKTKKIYKILFIFSWALQENDKKRKIEKINNNINELNGNTGDISDGFHTFDELYHHRAILFAMICNQNDLVAWKSKKHNDGTMYDGMFIVGIKSPFGQITYHYNLEYWDLYNVEEKEFAPEWDGSTSKDCIDRMQKWAKEIWR